MQATTIVAGETVNTDRAKLIVPIYGVNNAPVVSSSFGAVQLAVSCFVFIHRTNKSQEH